MGLGPSYNMLRDSYTCLQEETLFFICAVYLFLSVPFCLARRESFKYAGSHSHCPIGVSGVTRVKIWFVRVRGPARALTDQCKRSNTRRGAVGRSARAFAYMAQSV